MKMALLNAASLFRRGSSACQSPRVCAIPARRNAFVGQCHTGADPATPNSAFDVLGAWMAVIQTINFANPAGPNRRVTEINCLGPQVRPTKKPEHQPPSPKGATECNDPKAVEIAAGTFFLIGVYVARPTDSRFDIGSHERPRFSELACPGPDPTDI